jgi:transposase-like protein
VLDLLESGRKLDDVARDLQISPETIYEWRRQDWIDRGLQRGLTAREKAELRRRQEADRRVDVLGQEVDDTGSLT